MNSYSKTLFKLVVTSSLFVSHTVFADDINQVLKNNHIKNIERTPTIIKINKNPRTLNEYVLNSRIIYEEKYPEHSFIATSIKRKKINGWQDILGNPPSL